MSIAIGLPFIASIATAVGVLLGARTPSHIIAVTLASATTAVALGHVL